MTKRMYERLTKSTAKFWLAAGGLLSVSLLPCPECGTPMIFHAWPLVGFVLLARSIRKHAQRKGPMDADVSRQNSEAAFKELREKKEFSNG